MSTNGNGPSNANGDGNVLPPTSRGMAVDVAEWYISHLDPYKPNSENVRMHLREPVLALTIQVLLAEEAIRLHAEAPSGPVPKAVPKAAPKATAKAAPKAAPKATAKATAKAAPKAKATAKATAKEKVTKTNTGKSQWREYLQSSDDPQADNATKERNERNASLYQSLTRRTKTRMEAMLAGCMLAMTGSDNLANEQEDALLSSRSILQQQHHHHHEHVLWRSEQNPQNNQVTVKDGLAGFGASKDPSSTRSELPPPKSPTVPSVRSVRMPGSSLVRQMASPAPRRLCPQISEAQLVTRLELYIRTLIRVRALKEDCVIAMEQPKTIKARAKCLVQAFINTAACVRSMTPCLVRLLECMTKEVLAVDTLSKEGEKVIRRIASDYEHTTSFASLAFLSTPQAAADTRLTPLIVEYLKYLQSNWDEVVRSCELERMLSLAVDPEIRRFFKTVEFRSIGHLLEVCQIYKLKLQSVELPPNVSIASVVGANTPFQLRSARTSSSNPSPVQNSAALKQALKDLQREVITINGHVLPPVASRKELIHLLTQTLNSRTLVSEYPKHRQRRGHGRGRNKRSGAKTNKSSRKPSSSNESEGNETASTKSGQEQGAAATTPSDASSIPIPAATTSTDDSDILSSDIGESSGADISGTYDTDSSSAAPNSRRSVARNKRNSQKPPKRRSFHLSTVDLLTRRLLIAASRTGTGGDAFFVVRDLFGGEDVEVVSSQRMSTLPASQHMVRPGTMDILVRLADITIKCHASFDVYPKPMMGECEPLIQFHTTTTETISLQELRSTDGIANGQPAMQVNGSLPGTVVQERITPKTGWRTISIRPALYEKVEVWNTPS